VKEEIEAEKEAEGKSCWTVTEAGKSFDCDIPLGVKNKGGEGTAYALSRLDRGPTRSPATIALQGPC
jgi:hypothetical protein